MVSGGSLLDVGPTPLHWQRSFAWGFVAAYIVRSFQVVFTLDGDFNHGGDSAGPIPIPA